jgi:hypothetical protein
MVVFLSLSGTDDALTGTVAAGYVPYGHVVQSYSGTAYGSVAKDGTLSLTFDPAPDFAAAGQITGKASGSTLELTYPNSAAELVTLSFTRADAAGYNAALQALRDSEAQAQSSEDDAEASAAAEASSAAALETCTRAVVGHDAIVWAYNPGKDAAAACKDIKRYAIGDGEWDVPAQPAAPVNGSLVCTGRLDRMLVQVYDAGGQYYGGLICDRLPALPYLGIDYDAATDGTGLQIKLDGIGVGSPADKAGLHERDVIYAIDGDPTYSTTDLELILARHAPGDVVTVWVMRGSKSLDARLTLGRRP